MDLGILGIVVFAMLAIAMCKGPSNNSVDFKCTDKQGHEIHYKQEFQGSTPEVPADIKAHCE